jgi:AcrR family transcriptional regulator
MTTPRLSAEYLWLALIYWRSGYDTEQIARKLNVSEAAVYNSFANKKVKRRAAA